MLLMIDVAMLGIHWSVISYLLTVGALTKIALVYSLSQAIKKGEQF